MAIEDHPDFEEWRVALDTLKEATECLQIAVVFKRGNAAIRAARIKQAQAQAEFNRISDKIGNS